MPALLAALRDSAEPRLRRRLAWAGAAALAVAGVAVWAGFQLHARNAEAACVERGNEVRAIFNDDARAAMRRSFTATGVPVAQASFDLVAGVLGRYTDSLADRTVAMCRGTDDPPRLAEARQICMRERINDLTAFVGDLGATRDPIRVQRAPDQAWAQFDPARRHVTADMTPPTRNREDSRRSSASAC
jgi:hypothetical protein